MECDKCERRQKNRAFCYFCQSVSVLFSVERVLRKKIERLGSGKREKGEKKIIHSKKDQNGQVYLSTHFSRNGLTGLVENWQYCL